MGASRVLSRAGVLAVALLSPGAGAQTLLFQVEATSDDILSQPHDLVLSLDGHHLFIADNGKNRIAVLDPLTLKLLGEFGNGELSEPHDVVFDRLGRLLVADTGNSRVAIYKVEGNDGHLVGEIKGSVSRPEGVDVYPDGRVLVTGAASGNIAMFDGGREVAQAGGFAAPHDVQVDGKGDIWVADTGHDRIVRLDQNLAVTSVIEGEPYGFNGPRYLKFDSAGRMFVADKDSNAIKVLDAHGKLVQVLGGGKAGRGEGEFDRPEGVEIRGADVWFSDTYNNRIVRYRALGG